LKNIDEAVRIKREAGVAESGHRVEKSGKKTVLRNKYEKKECP